MNNKLLLCMGPTRSGTTYLWNNLSREYNTHPLKETYSWSKPSWPGYVVMYNNQPLKMSRSDLEKLITTSDKPFMEMSPCWHELFRPHDTIKYFIEKYDTSFIVSYRDPILAVESAINNFYNILNRKNHTKSMAEFFKTTYSTLNVETFEKMCKKMKPLRNDTLLFHQYKYSSWVPKLENLTDKIIYIDFNKLGNSEYLNKKFNTNIVWDKLKYNSSNHEVMNSMFFDNGLKESLQKFYQDDYDYINATFDKYM